MEFLKLQALAVSYLSMKCLTWTLNAKLYYSVLIIIS